MNPYEIHISPKAKEDDGFADAAREWNNKHVDGNRPETDPISPFEDAMDYYRFIDGETETNKTLSDKELDDLYDEAQIMAQRAWSLVHSGASKDEVDQFYNDLHNVQTKGHFRLAGLPDPEPKPAAQASPVSQEDINEWNGHSSALPDPDEDGMRRVAGPLDGSKPSQVPEVASKLAAKPWHPPMALTFNPYWDQKK